MIHTDQHVSIKIYVGRMTVIVVVLISPGSVPPFEVEIGATWDKSNLLLSPWSVLNDFMGRNF